MSETVSYIEEYRKNVRKGVPCLFEFLTRQEFQLCWAIVFAAGAEEYSDEFAFLESYATPGANAEMIEERFRRAMRYLADSGWKFRGIALDGWEVLGKTPPIEPRNLAYFMRFAAGSMPSPVVSLEAAIPVVRDQLGLEALAAALEDALEEVRQMKAETVNDTMEIM